MNLFKTFRLKWWQAGYFKLGALASGITIGAYCCDFFGGYRRGGFDPRFRGPRTYQAKRRWLLQSLR
jgi:hypothetical protein